MDVSFLKNILVKSGLSENMALWLAGAAWLIILILASYVIYWLTKKILLNTVARFIKKTKTKRDDILLKHKIFEKLSHIVPILFLYLAIPLFLHNYPGLLTILKKALGLYLLIVTVLLTNSLLNAFHSFYLTLPVSRNRPIKGYIQVIQVLVYFSGLMFTISILFNVSVLSLFTGLGAMAAVIMLIFKDTILGFVASLQISGNDMLKPGD